ncbi:hypothetical protein MBLNU230_g5327t1 [Neophaeotheca triangularis]
MASPLRDNPSAPPLNHPNMHAELPSSSSLHARRTPSNLDEGYSEDTRSQSDTSMNTAHDATTTLINDIVARAGVLSGTDLEHLAYTLGSQLPVSSIARLQDKLKNLCFFDPVNYLPNELVLDIFSRLTPKEILRAASVSRQWHVRTQDQRLWRQCFAREGWKLDKEKMRVYETMAKHIREEPPLPEESSLGLTRSTSRKRRVGEAFEDGEPSSSSQAAHAAPQAQTWVQRIPAGNGAERAEQAQGDSDEMVGVEKTVTEVREESSKEAADAQRSYEAATIIDQSHVQVAPLPFQPDLDNPKLSWPYLYKQRRRLEKNWDEGKCTPFRLPHPSHPNEGHQECVYTIQHSAKHLVSGSRDKTIRIWDMDTCRLARPPLQGHEASVLCLQFDERPEHDIIVSGGSDSWVIIWRFSTGEIIKKMTTAHDESVLNLRFDDRYIVTCSKDKKIKLWNRREIARDSPLIPTPALQQFSMETDVSPLPPYTLLYRLEGHMAAVNAVMIHENTIVSASGDRTIKSWDIKSGKQQKNYPGHTKGIACVQYDGRRIVSGSSDNTVRIFDANKVAELACLVGHNNLVRTVQARFGDLETTTDRELEAEARLADKRFFRALDGGMQPAAPSRRALRNAGSSRPEDMLSVGTVVPPGGGGSRWSRIVSGSYDETVIVWKRDADGKWLPKHKLQQDLRRGPRNAGPQPQQPAHQPNPPILPAAVADAGPLAQHAAQNQLLNMRTQLQHQLDISQRALSEQQAAQQTSADGSNGNVNVANPQAAHQQPNGNPAAGSGPHHHHHHHHYHHHGTLNGGGAAAVNNNATASAATASANTNGPGMPNANANANAALSQQQVQGQAQFQANLAQWQQQAQPNQAQNQNQNQHQHPIPAQGPTPAAAAAAAVQQNPLRESNRVFKLQFDTRRIVCCSQNKVIVGWDFAAGDRELEEIGGWSLETA